MSDFIEKTADRIQQHFFAKGAVVSQEDFDFVRTALEEAEQKGRDMAVDYIEDNSEERERQRLGIGEHIVYATNNEILDAARSHKGI